MASWQSSMDCIQDELHKSWNASHDVLKIFTRNYDVSVWLRPSVVAMKSLRPGFSLENCGNLVDFVHQGLPQEEDVQNIQKRGRNGEAFKPSTSPPFIDSGWHRVERPDSALPLATRGKFQKTWRCFIQVVEIQTLMWSSFAIIIPLGKVFSEQFLVSGKWEIPARCASFSHGMLRSLVSINTRCSRVSTRLPVVRQTQESAATPREATSRWDANVVGLWGSCEECILTGEIPKPIGSWWVVDSGADKFLKREAPDSGFHIVMVTWRCMCELLCWLSGASRKCSLMPSCVLELVIFAFEKMVLHFVQWKCCIWHLAIRLFWNLKKKKLCWGMAPRNLWQNCAKMLASKRWAKWSFDEHVTC